MKDVMNLVLLASSILLLVIAAVSILSVHKGLSRLRAYSVMVPVIFGLFFIALGVFTPPQQTIIFVDQWVVYDILGISFGLLAGYEYLFMVKKEIQEIDQLPKTWSVTYRVHPLKKEECFSFLCSALPELEGKIANKIVKLVFETIYISDLDTPDLLANELLPLGVGLLFVIVNAKDGSPRRILIIASRHGSIETMTDMVGWPNPSFIFRLVLQQDPKTVAWIDQNEPLPDFLV